MAPAVSHPVEPVPGHEPPPGFVRVEHKGAPDEHWHFAMYLPADVVCAHEGALSPELDASTSLGLYQTSKPAVDFEVMGSWLRYEIDPADWLDAQLEVLGYEVQSRRPVRLANGTAGDAVATWSHDQRAYVGRFMAAKYGARLYTVCCRTSADDYDRVATSMFTAAASLRPLHEWPGIFAETVSFVEDDAPFDWKVALPKSWQVVQHPGDDEGAWFEASHLAPTAPDEQLGERDGRLALAVMTRGSAKRPRDAANVYLTALEDNGTRIADADFLDDISDEPFSQAWYLTSSIEREGVRGEVRCRVMMHEHAWIVGGVVGPSRDDDQDAWMRNKRALDIATTTLEVDTSV